jgi:hypothetical protein
MTAVPTRKCSIVAAHPAGAALCCVPAVGDNYTTLRHLSQAQWVLDKCNDVTATAADADLSTGQHVLSTGCDLRDHLVNQRHPEVASMH